MIWFYFDSDLHQLIKRTTDLILSWQRPESVNQKNNWFDWFYQLIFFPFQYMSKTFPPLQRVRPFNRDVIISLWLRENIYIFRMLFNYIYIYQINLIDGEYIYSICFFNHIYIIKLIDGKYIYIYSICFFSTHNQSSDARRKYLRRWTASVFNRSVQFRLYVMNLDCRIPCICKLIRPGKLKQFTN